MGAEAMVKVYAGQYGRPAAGSDAGTAVVSAALCRLRTGSVGGPRRAAAEEDLLVGRWRRPAGGSGAQSRWRRA
jgi:hypothetical protein